jgi:hypothetical protein
MGFLSLDGASRSTTPKALAPQHLTEEASGIGTLPLLSLGFIFPNPFFRPYLRSASRVEGESFIRGQLFSFRSSFLSGRS